MADSSATSIPIESEPEASEDKGFKSAVSLAQAKMPAPTPIAVPRQLGSGMYSLGIVWARRISVKEFDEFIELLYTNLTLAIYRQDTKPKECFLTAKDFQTVMHCAIQMRVCAVARVFRGAKNPKNWIDFQRNFEVPKPFCVLLNNIGRCFLNQKTLTVFPFPDTTTDADGLYDEYLAVKLRYLTFLKMLKSNVTVPTDVISDKINGSRFWTLDTVLTIDKARPADITSVRMRVRTVFADVSDQELKDAAYAARGIVNAKFYQATNLTLDLENQSVWTPSIWCYTPIFVNIIEDRISFCAMSRKS